MAEIRDVVHGFIQLDEQEVEIINHPVFQRLRRIKQLSLTDMVYPGANHTRFEHSLGVMQMATEMFDSIISKKQAHDILCSELKFDEAGLGRARKIIRLAALLHDVGHSPFSHAGEMTMPLISESEKRYSHEDYSIAIIKKYFGEIIENHPISQNYGLKTSDVTILLGDESVKITKNAIWKDLISGQLDADRSDYLLRDSIHLGVSYGLYDKSRLINCITIGRHYDSEALSMAIERSGWHIAESLVIARYQMFSQVYFHKTRRIFDYHVGQAIKAILHELKLPGDTYPSPDHLDQYIEFDDWKMYGALKSGMGGSHGKIILNRTPYHCIVESNEPPTKEDIQKLEEKKQECTNRGIDYYIDNKATTSWYKIEKDILISLKDNSSTVPLSTLSKIVNAMVEKPKTIRLYIPKEESL